MEKPFVLPVQTPLGHYIYEVGRNEILEVNKDLYDYIVQILEDKQAQDNLTISNIAKAEYKELQKLGFLLPSPVKQIIHPLTYSAEVLLDRNLQSLTLQVTQNCNLRCRYCIYSEVSNLNQRTHSRKVMSFETAKSAVDFYYRHSMDASRISIAFYGGEPLLNFPLICDIVDYAERLFEGRELIFAITTNATLLSDDIIDFILSHKFYITLSIDGAKEIQDRNRVFSNGSGSYDRVMANIRRLYEKDPQKLKNVTVNMVVDDTQDFDSLNKLFEDEQTLENVHLLYSLAEKDGLSLPPSIDFSTQYNYASFLSMVHTLRCKTENSPVSKFMEDDSRFLSRDLTEYASSFIETIAAPNGPCLPGMLRLFVNCDGDFYPCERVNENEIMKIGSLSNGFDIKKITRLLNVSQLSAEKCKTCWAFFYCGLCAKRADNGNEISAEKLSLACHHAKNNAYYKICRRIMLYEYGQHMIKMNKSAEAI